MPIAFNWQRTYAWDKKHCNISEIKANDPHPDRLAQALENTTADHGAAFSMWRDLAHQGSVHAMVETAYRFEAGVGVAQDAASAEHWYAAAAAGGSQWALLRYAKLQGERNDLRGTEALLREQATEGWVPAMFWLAWYRLKDSGARERYSEIRPLLERAAEAGHPGAQWMLGRAMASGKYGRSEMARGRALLMDLSSEIVAEIESQAHG